MLSKHYTRANFTDYLPWVVYTSYVTLVQQGVHIGHSVRNFNAYSSWMIMGSHMGLCLINLFKFMYMLRAGLFIVQHIIRKRAPIWFVNLDHTSEGIIKSAALLCGEYWISRGWVPGLISNFRRVSKAGKKGVLKLSVLARSSDYRWFGNFMRWGWTRDTWPRGIFVSNGDISYVACHEAMSLGIPSLTIVDTNARYKHVTVAIPGNASSFLTVSFYNFLMSMFVMYNKFIFVYNWYIYSWINTHATIRLDKFNSSPTIFNSALKVRLNVFNFSSPDAINYYNYANLYFYQDIWKQRALRGVYLKTPSLGEHIADDLRESIGDIYTTYILSSWGLCKGYIYSRIIPYTTIVKRAFIGKRLVKGHIHYRGHGLRGKTSLFGNSVMYWLQRFVIHSRLHNGRAFNLLYTIIGGAMNNITRGQHHFLRRSRLYVHSQQAIIHSSIRYHILLLALMFHVIHNGNLFSTTWMARSAPVSKKQSRSTRKAQDGRGMIAHKISQILRKGSTSSWFTPLVSRSDDSILPMQFRLYAGASSTHMPSLNYYIRYAGIKFAKRISVNRSYLSEQSLNPMISVFSNKASNTGVIPSFIYYMKTPLLYKNNKTTTRVVTLS